MSDVLLFAPELVLLLFALALFCCPLFELSYRLTRQLALVSGVAALAACLWTLDMTGEPFSPGIYRVDFFSQSMKIALALGYLAVVAISSRPQTTDRAAWLEYPLFLLLATLGTMMMVSATELLTLYIAMELAAYPLYIAVALHRTPQTGVEGASKFMLQGMVSSAISLYGMSFLFGVFGTTYLSGIALGLPAATGNPLAWVGLLLLLAGFFFKLAAFPFHFWAPDTYQTAPHQVVTYLATVSKVAAIALLCRLLALVSSEWSGSGVSSVLLWTSVVAMSLGNLAALVQRDLKRLLGYSAVAHAGYLLIGLQTGALLGFSAALFYAFAYLAMSFICFLVVCEVGQDSDLVQIESVAGLHQRSPFLAATLLVGIFGLIGLPPTVGFIGKWLLFSAALEQGQFLLVLVAAVNAVVGLYYYLLVLRQAYLMPADGAAPIYSCFPVRTAAAVGVVLVLVMGTFPGRYWDVASRAASMLLD